MRHLTPHVAKREERFKKYRNFIQNHGEFEFKIVNCYFQQLRELNIVHRFTSFFQVSHVSECHQKKFVLQCNFTLK